MLNSKFDFHHARTAAQWGQVQGRLPGAFPEHGEHNDQLLNVARVEAPE
jgi:hypothetical protein